jgi:DNA-binding winged helix-turn-helix (wHTH) protein
VLAYLVQNHDRLITKDELIERIWPEKYISDAALSSRVMAARKALGDNGKAQRFIRTMHGRGFRFVGQVRVLLSDRDREGIPQRAEAPTLPATEPGAPPPQEIRFARSRDGVQIAYAIAGSGPPLVRRRTG